MSEKKLLQRCDIAVEDTWATEDLFPSDEAWEEALKSVEGVKQKAASYAGHLCENAETLYQYMKDVEDSSGLFDRLGNYCSRKSDVDTRVTKYQEMCGRYRGVMVSLNAATSFERTEILALSDEEFESFFKAEPKLERYRRYLMNIRRKKAHTLSEAEEKLLAAAGEMAQAPYSTYSVFANADMKFADAVDSKGEKHPLNMGNFVALESSPDRVLRKSAYESLYASYAASKNTAASLIDAQNKQLKFFANARKYPGAVEAATDNNQVPTSVYTNLIEAVHQNIDKMNRYISLRKKLMGLEDMHFYDLYTPLVPDADAVIPFAEAKKIVYEALEPLGEEYRAILKEGFENRWIDVYPNEGKRSGAYSAGAGVHPYVLLNQTDTLDSMFTLAHEMGHALHSYLSNHTQNPLDAHYVIFVAEVASTCNEALLMEYLLGKTTDKRQRAYLINHFLDQFRGTLYRQTMFAEFELIIGRMVEEGKTLTAEVLSDVYGKLNKFYYGEDIVVDEQISGEWAKIPHLFMNYYMFQYATGYSAAIALSRRILKEGKSAVEDYLNFLRGGCTKTPIDLLKGAGVDMTTPDAVNSALSLFGELLDEMEALMA